MGIENGKSQVDFGLGFWFVLRLIWFQGFHKFGDWNPFFGSDFWFSGKDKKVGIETENVGWGGAET